MTTVCLIGNSHVANLKLALPSVQPDFPDVRTIFFASDGTTMELDVVSGRLVARTGYVRERMAMTSGTMGDIEPIYDAYVPCGLTLSSVRAMRTYPATMQALRRASRDKDATAQDLAAGMAPQILQSLAFDIATKLRRLTDAPIFIVATPLTAYERHTAMWQRYESKGVVELLAAAFDLACHSAAKDIGAVFVPQPFETVGPNALTTRPEFYRLSVEETAAERANHAHMNAAFGAIVLRDVLRRIVATFQAAGSGNPASS